jgi:hypothetical protein
MPGQEISLLDYWDAGICPQCGVTIAEGTQVGTGMKADGAFCSLDCLVMYHGRKFIDDHEQRIKSVTS